MVWSGLIELVRALVFAASHVCGGSLGGGILVVSFLREPCPIVRIATPKPLELRLHRGKTGLVIAHSDSDAQRHR